MVMKSTRAGSDTVVKGRWRGPVTACFHLQVWEPRSQPVVLAGGLWALLSDIPEPWVCCGNRLTASRLASSLH